MRVLAPVPFVIREAQEDFVSRTLRKLYINWDIKTLIFIFDFRWAYDSQGYSGLYIYTCDSL
jgi:hypothetical protein